MRLQIRTCSLGKITYIRVFHDLFERHILVSQEESNEWFTRVRFVLSAMLNALHRDIHL